MRVRTGGRDGDSGSGRVRGRDSVRSRDSDGDRNKVRGRGSDGWRQPPTASCERDACTTMGDPEGRSSGKPRVVLAPSQLQ